MNITVLQQSDFEDFKRDLFKEIKALRYESEKQFLKTADVRKMLGGISASKLQSLRIGGYLPAIYADGLWLYDVDDIMSFINNNKCGKEENCEDE